MMGKIGKFCFPQTLQTHIFFPVEEGNVGMFFPQVTGKTLVDGGLSAVGDIQSLFKVDIKGVLSQRAAHSHSDGRISVHQQKTFHT